MAIDAGFKLNLGLIVACSGYPHPNCAVQKCPPLIVSHGLFDDVVLIKLQGLFMKKLKAYRPIIVN